MTVDLTRIKVSADEGLPSVNARYANYPKNAPYLWGRSPQGASESSRWQGSTE